MLIENKVGFQLIKYDSHRGKKSKRIEVYLRTFSGQKFISIQVNQEHVE
jgi:hypothetical protein